MAKTAESVLPFLWDLALTGKPVNFDAPREALRGRLGYASTLARVFNIGEHGGCRVVDRSPLGGRMVTVPFCPGFATVLRTWGPMASMNAAISLIPEDVKKAHVAPGRVKGVCDWLRANPSFEEMGGVPGTEKDAVAKKALQKSKIARISNIWCFNPNMGRSAHSAASMKELEGGLGRSLFELSGYQTLADFQKLFGGTIAKEILQLPFTETPLRTTNRTVESIQSILLSCLSMSMLRDTTVATLNYTHQIIPAPALKLVAAAERDGRRSPIASGVITLDAARLAQLRSFGELHALTDHPEKNEKTRHWSNDWCERMIQHLGNPAFCKVYAARPLLPAENKSISPVRAAVAYLQHAVLTHKTATDVLPFLTELQVTVPKLFLNKAKREYPDEPVRSHRQVFFAAFAVGKSFCYLFLDPYVVLEMLAAESHPDSALVVAHRLSEWLPEFSSKPSDWSSFGTLAVMDAQGYPRRLGVITDEDAATQTKWDIEAQKMIDALPFDGPIKTPPASPVKAPAPATASAATAAAAPAPAVAAPVAKPPTRDIAPAPVPVPPTPGHKEWVDGEDTKSNGVKRKNGADATSARSPKKPRTETAAAPKPSVVPAQTASAVAHKVAAAAPVAPVAAVAPAAVAVVTTPVVPPAASASAAAVPAPAVAMNDVSPAYAEAFELMAKDQLEFAEGLMNFTVALTDATTKLCEVARNNYLKFSGAVKKIKRRG